MKTALILHGAFGGPDENWIPWLSHQLSDEGYGVVVPEFPTPEEQNFSRWMSIAEPHLPELDEESIVVGHSLGVLFGLQVLERLDRQINAAFLVSGFLDEIGIEEFDSINKSFYEHGVDWESVKSAAADFYVFHGDNDPNVPLEKAYRIADELGVEVNIIEGGGHLNAGAGFTEFPQLLNTITET